MYQSKFPNALLPRVSYTDPFIMNRFCHYGSRLQQAVVIAS